MLLMKVIYVVTLCMTIEGNSLMEVLVEKDSAALFVKNILAEFNSQDSTHEVALLRLHEKEKQTVDDICERLMSEMPKENIVMTPNLLEKTQTRDTKKASVIIIVSDIYDHKNLGKEFETAKDSQYWSISAKFIFVSTHIEKSRLKTIAMFLRNLNVLNAVIIGLKDDYFIVYSFDTFTRRFYRIERDSKIDKLFPDRLKNLKGYRYRTLSATEYPIMFIKNKKIKGTGMDFMRAVAKHQNATSSNGFIKPGPGREKILANAFNKMQIDLSLNNGITLSGENAEKMKFVNTFETDGYCAMLPFGARRSFFSYVLKPFDDWTWILIMTAMTCFVIVWHFLNKYSQVHNPNSAGYLLFAFITFFIGQSVEFRERRMMQKVLIQLMVLMTFVLGNAYQSVLTSLMTESRFGEKITNIQDMIDSGFSFEVDPIFMQMFNASEQYEELRNKTTGTVGRLKDLNFADLAARKVGLVLTCNTIAMLYHDAENSFKIDKKAIDYYYRMPEKLYTYYLRFPTAAYSPFAERLQDYSLKIHESGVKQHWKTLLSFEDMEAVKQREFDANEDFLLNLQDMAGAFYCLVIGFTAALLTFLLEIFWFNYLKDMEWNIAGSIRRRFRWLGRRNRVAPLRIIQVQPQV